MTNFGPYEKIRKSGSTYYLSGILGVDPQTGSAPSSITDQTNIVLDTMSSLLKEHGMGMSDVIKTTVFLTNMDAFQDFNNVYSTHFRPPRPARSTVAVQELPRIGDVPLLVEIEAVAIKERQ